MRSPSTSPDLARRVRVYSDPLQHAVIAAVVVAPLAARVGPGVVRTAVAAALGAGVVVVGGELGLPPAPLAITGAAACFLLRFFAIRKGWRLPVARVHAGK